MKKSCNFLCFDLFCLVRLEIMKNVGILPWMSWRHVDSRDGYLGYSGEIAVATCGTRDVDDVQIFD